MNDITRALLATLHERYPVIAERKPLAIGIHQQLLNKGYDPALLRRVLSIHIRSVKYALHMSKGGVRHNLDGTEAGPIDPDHAEFARQKIEELDRKTAEKVLLKKELKAKLAASRAVKPESAPKSKSAAKAPPTVKVTAKTPPAAKTPIIAVVVKKRRVVQVPK